MVHCCRTGELTYGASIVHSHELRSLANFWVHSVRPFMYMFHLARSFLQSCLLYIYMSTDGFFLSLMASRKNGLRGSDWFFLTGENWLVFPGEKWLFYPVANKGGFVERSPLLRRELYQNDNQKNENKKIENEKGKYKKSGVHGDNIAQKERNNKNVSFFFRVRFRSPASCCRNLR